VTEAPVTFTVELRLAWWWWPYFYTLLFFVFMTEKDPDVEKILRMFRRALRARVVE